MTSAPRGSLTPACSRLHNKVTLISGSTSNFNKKRLLRASCFFLFSLSLSLSLSLLLPYISVYRHIIAFIPGNCGGFPSYLFLDGVHLSRCCRLILELEASHSVRRPGRPTAPSLSRLSSCLYSETGRQAKRKWRRYCHLIRTCVAFGGDIAEKVYILLLLFFFFGDSFKLVCLIRELLPLPRGN